MPVRPITEPEKVVLEFEFDVSQDFVEEQIDLLGVRPATRWSIDFDLEEVPVRLRPILREAHGRYVDVEPFPEIPGPTEDAEEFLSLLLPWLSEVEQAELAEAQQQEVDEALEIERQQKFASEMREWTRVHGSTRLRRALERGYKVNTTYAVERGASELPGFWVDTAGDVEWGERSDPSVEALTLEESVGRQLADRSGDQGAARIVWLTAPPRALERSMEDERDEYFEPQEAILVENFLNRYNAVLPIDSDLHRSGE